MPSQLQQLHCWLNRYLRPVLPLGVLHSLRVFRGWLSHIRVNRWVTMVLGPQYRRSATRIEIDITYACNLSCNNCNRSVEQAPTGEHMSVEQIKYFIDESKVKGSRWHRIRLLGGEPTLHKHFFQILEILREYKRNFSPRTQIEVCTNGYGEKVEQILSKIPHDVNVVNSAKSGNIQPSFDPFNIAPKDVKEQRYSDFINGCWIAQNSGIGLGPSGYYPCAVAAAMDRVFGWNIGRQTLPNESDTMEDLLKICCQHCGHFDRRLHPPIFNKEQSQSWKGAYARYRDGTPKLTKYGETSRQHLSMADSTGLGPKRASG